MNKNQQNGPDQVAQLIRTYPNTSQYTKIASLIPAKGTYRNQQMNAKVSRTTNPVSSLSLPLSAFPSLKSILKINKVKFNANN